MPLKKLPYKTLDSLIADNLSKEEWEQTVKVINEVKPARQRGWLTKEELVIICRWKSPRVIHHINSNHPNTIKSLSQKAFSCSSEEVKITELVKLRGVSLPMASSILMLTNPKRYGVIDIRVWEILFETGTVQSNSKGTDFKFEEWNTYLEILRFFAGKFKVKARDIERTLFLVHKKYQDGQLYSNLTKAINIK